MCNYYVISIISLMCMLLVVTFFILSAKKCDCKTKFPSNEITNSKSQFGQDVTMFFKHFINKTDGVFVELGAFDGVTISNTYFYEKNLNWHGILIEGGEKNCRMLFANANKRSNSKLVCSPICKSEYISFKEEGTGGMLDRKHKSSRRIKCNTLSNITHFYDIKHIDFFSLDVEGSELEVLETFDFNVSVSYWLIEWANLNESTKNKIEKLLRKNGYAKSNELISDIDVLFSRM